MVLIRGNGGAFCCGGDLREIHNTMITGRRVNIFSDVYPMNARISTYKIPYVAIIDGITMGGGVGLSIHGDYRIATERTVFAMPECSVGLFPDVGASKFLPRMGKEFGLFLGLTGWRLRGKDVLKVGVATHFTKSENIPALEAAILETKSRTEIETVLNLFCANRVDELSFDHHKKQIESCFSAKTVEEIFENLHSDGSEWANVTMSMMNKMSPTSLKITKLQQERGGQMDNLKDCLRMEYRLAQRVTDFGEGIRALIIDKDQNPNWQPKRLQDVTESYVESLFEPLEQDLIFD